MPVYIVKRIGYVQLGPYFCMTGNAMRCSMLAIDVQIDVLLAKAAFGKHGVQRMLLGVICIQNSNGRSLLSNRAQYWYGDPELHLFNCLDGQ